MEAALFKDLIVICGLAVGVIFFCRRLGIHPVVGFLLTGVLCGPHGLSLVQQVHDVEQVADIGVICLLFTIGLEFSLKRLLEIKFLVLAGGTLQVVLTLTATAGIAAAMGLDLNPAIFVGCLATLSSTAIVLKILQQRGLVESPHGRLSVGILLFQDIAIVPMILFAPVLAGGTQDPASAFLLLAGKVAAILLLMVIAARWIVPFGLYQIARLLDRELFLVGVVFVGSGVAWLTYALGLSPALGAFVAGLIISESEYSHRALGNMLPFRDLFISFFFVSVGMLLDIRYAVSHALPLTLVTSCLIIVKFLAAGSVGVFLGLPLRTAVLAGIALCQVGEFSFVLSETGLDLGLLKSDLYQLFLGVAVTTMIATPFLLNAGPRIADLICRLPLLDRLGGGRRDKTDPSARTMLGDHLIIVGFGLNGRHLSQAAAAAGIPRVIIEMNPRTVRTETAAGLPIFYGDASQESVLDHAGLRRARLIVIVISDPAATQRIVETARRLNPGIYIISRTRFLTQLEPLFELGADEVVPEDYEASVEVVARVLSRYLVPKDDIERFLAGLRSDHYRMLRSLSQEAPTMGMPSLEIPDTEIAAIRIHPDSVVTGKSLAETELRRKYGVTALALRRNQHVAPNPSADDKLEADDVLVLFGSPEDIARATAVLRGRGESGTQ